jgi:hypothetical protein
MARSCAVFLLFAVISIVPWLAKDWLWLGNPVAPFLNRVFPNPYVTVEFEDLFRNVLAHANGLTLAQMPWEATVRGFRSCGLFGWVFLLSPIALLSLAKKEGRQLLLAALVFALPLVANKGARFLIPAIPFLSLAMGIALARLPLLAAMIVLAHAITSWPPVLTRYCHQWAWRLTEAPWAAAFHLVPEEQYITAHVPEYPASKMLERQVPPDGRVFSFNTVAASYCNREVLVGFGSAENLRLRDLLYLATNAGYQTQWRFTFSFPPRPLYGIRVVQTAAGSDIWKIAELTVNHEGAESPVLSSWQLTAKPFPWHADLGVDRQPATYWRADRALYPGMFYQIRFGGSPQLLDNVLLDCPPDQSQIRLRLEGEVAPDRWQFLATPDLALRPLAGVNLRRGATAELRRSGVGYLLNPPDGIITQDVEKNPAAWGLTQVDAINGWRLYRVD